MLFSSPFAALYSGQQHQAIPVDLIRALLQPCSAWERAWQHAIGARQTSPDKNMEV